MTEVPIIVTLQVDPNGVDEKHLSREQLQRAALQAVTNAVKYGEQEGFVHDLAESVSVGVASIDLMIIPQNLNLSLTKD